MTEVAERKIKSRVFRPFLFFLILSVFIPSENANGERISGVFGRSLRNLGLGGLVGRVVGTFNDRNFQQIRSGLFKRRGRNEFVVGNNGNLNLFENDSGSLRQLNVFSANLGARTQAGARQAGDFIAENRNRFNSRRLADIGIRNSGGNLTALNGIVKLYVKTLVPGKDETNLPPGINERFKQDWKSVAASILNGFLNSISRSTTLIRVRPQDIRNDGTITLNLGRFFDRDQLALFARSDPNSRCRGGTIDAQTMMAFNLDPEKYAVHKQSSKNRDQFLRNCGCEDDDFSLTRQRIALSESDVAPGAAISGRVVHFRAADEGRGACVFTDDVDQRNTPGGNADDASVFTSGIFTGKKAEEHFCITRNRRDRLTGRRTGNGYPEVGLYDANKNRVNFAPAQNAAGANSAGALAIANSSLACYSCHWRGGGFLIAGDKRYHDTSVNTNRGLLPANTPVYTDNFPKIQARFGNEILRGVRSRAGAFLSQADFFTTNRGYVGPWRNPLNQIVTKSLKDSGAIYQAATGEFGRLLFPSSYGQYFEDLNTEAMARAQGVSKEFFEKAFPALVGKQGEKDKSVKRTTWDQRFCDVRSRLAAAARGDAQVALQRSGNQAAQPTGQQAPASSTPAATASTATPTSSRGVTAAHQQTAQQTSSNRPVVQ